MSNIPKIIHYCWFGRNPLPESAQKCITSWRKFFPDYEIKEWNEDSFNVNIVPYTQEAYSVKKYAFVSDYARFWILYKYGGLYFDTDVEVIKPMDDIIARGGFMGIEVDGKDGTFPQIAPGLGLGIEAAHPIYKSVLDHYATQKYLNADGKPNNITVVKHNTQVLKEHGLIATNELQEVDGIWIYPREFFNPLNDNTGVLTITQNTRSIHWYTKTWVTNYNPLKHKITQLVHRYFGVKSLQWIKALKNKKMTNGNHL